MTTKELKYKLQILKLLFRFGSLSSNDISKHLDKSLSLTIRILEELLNFGIICTSGFAPSNGGRRALTYQINPNQLYIIGISINRFSTRIALFDLASQDSIEEVKFEYSLKEGQSSFEYITQKLYNFIDNSQTTKDKIIGIGMGMPGFIDTTNDKNLTYKWENISAQIFEHTNIPTFIDNDSSCVALAEQNFGEAKQCNIGMVINISWGIGLGMLINDKIYRGEKGFAGEFSHIPIFKNNMLCSCGKVGCLETETSLQYIISKIKEDINEDKPTILTETLGKSLDQDFESLINAVQKGDFLATESISKAAYKIGQGIAILIHILNPQKIILSGQGAAIGDIWLPPIQQALNEFCIKKLVADVEVTVSKLEKQAEILGAASLIIENIEEITFLTRILDTDFFLTTKQ